MENIRIITGNAHRKLAAEIAKSLGVPLCNSDVSSFPDNETKVRILEDIRGKDVFIVQPTCPPANHNLMELLILCDACRRSSAQCITAVIPYFGYARQDRKHEGRVPITAKLVANLISVSGATRVLTMDLHATQIQGFFDIPVDHLFAAPVMLEYIGALGLDDRVIVAPDPGSIKMAHAYAKRLNAGLALIEKRRVTDSEVARGQVVGDIKNKNVLIVDDMISTAGSMVQAISACREHGAATVRAMATHAVLCGPAYERLAKAAVDEIVVTDTIPLPADCPDIGLKVLTVAPYLAEAIKRIRTNRSLSELFVDASGNAPG